MHSTKFFVLSTLIVVLIALLTSSSSSSSCSSSSSSSSFSPFSSPSSSSSSPGTCDPANTVDEKEIEQRNNDYKELLEKMVQGLRRKLKDPTRDRFDFYLNLQHSCEKNCSRKEIREFVTAVFSAGSSVEKTTRFVQGLRKH